MGGGDDEDPIRALERLERDLAAIDARWASEGYQQRTTSQVLDDERKTRRELARRIAQLRGLPPPMTPAAGTVALNVGSAWRPLAVSEAPEVSGAPLPAFDVQGAEEELPPPLEELERELHVLLTSGVPAYASATPLGKLTARFRKTPGALRLLAAGWRSIAHSQMAAQLVPPRSAMATFQPRVVRHPLLTGATELPNETTGLTPTQTSLMRVLRQSAPETGPYIRASEVFAEARVALPDLEEGTFMREVSLLGHPSLRRLPLVSFHGFAGRVSASPSFTHVRLTPIGREVIDGTFPLPNLLANGASGDGVCLLPMAPSELVLACLAVFEGAERWLAHGAAFDLPEGTSSAAFGFHNAMTDGHEAKVLARPIRETEVNAGEQRCRLVFRAFPWPYTVADYLPELEKLVRQGDLDGVVAFSDESSADSSRLTIEVEHVAFVRELEQKLRNCGLFDVHYTVEARVPAWPPSDRGYSVPSLRDFIRAFLETRKEAAVKRLDAEVLRFKVEAQRMEAVCVALLMIDRVLGVLREALDDAEGEAALMTCMRPEDRKVLGRLPFPASHDYAQGFTKEQARHQAQVGSDASRRGADRLDASARRRRGSEADARGTAQRDGPRAPGARAGARAVCDRAAALEGVQLSEFEEVRCPGG